MTTKTEASMKRPVAFSITVGTDDEDGKRGLGGIVSRRPPWTREIPYANVACCTIELCGWTDGANTVDLALLWLLAHLRDSHFAELPA